MREGGKQSTANPIGIMQGRLSPPEDGRFQSFPRNSWRQEFERARRAGLAYIEWIHDAYGHTANPIFTEEGLAELDAQSASMAFPRPRSAAIGSWIFL